MKKLHFSITIDASKEKVWHSMIDEKPFRDWTKAFAKDSRFEGCWDKGCSIKFLMNEKGSEMGMFSRIAENRPYEFLSIEHLGMITDGKEDRTSEAAKNWTPMFENYTLKSNGKKTEVLVEMDTEEQYAEMADKMWLEALQDLKRIAERQ